MWITVLLLLFFLPPASCFLLPSIAHASLTSGLVGYWTFDGKDTVWTGPSSGTTNDLSGNGNTGTLSGMSQSTSTAAGKLGQAINFTTGTSYSVNIGQPASLSYLFGAGTSTITAWIYPNSNTIGEVIIANTGGAANCPSTASGWMMRINATLLEWCAFAAGKWRSTGAISPGAWHFVVVRMSTTTNTMPDFFVDGVPSAVSLGSPATNFTELGQGGGNITIGNVTATSTGAGGKFLGKVDDVRIYKRELSASEITQLYKQGAAKFAVSPTQSLTSGLVGYWTFDGKNTNWATGQTNDLSGQGNTGSLISMSTTTTPVPGKIGQALKFDGTSSYVNTGFTTNNTNFTTSAWIKLASLGCCGRVVSKDNSHTGWSLSYGDPGSGALRFYIRGMDTVSLDTATSLLSTNKWYHVVAVFDKTNQKRYIYINGSVSTSNLSDTGTPSGDAAGLTIGESESGTFFNGTIDDVRIYNYALSTTSVQQLYKQGAAKMSVSPSVGTGQQGLNAGLVGYWTFDGKDTVWTSPTAATTLDKSGNGNTGTLTSMNQATTPVVGKIGQALKFNGTSSYINTSAQILSNTPTAMTYSAWVYFKGLQDGIIVNSTRTSDGRYMAGLLYHTSDNKIDFSVDEFATHAASNVTPNPNKWYHVVGVYDVNASPKETLYINGVLQTTTANTTTTLAGGDAIVIGARNDGSLLLNGTIDDVRIYSRALSATEVNTLYKQGASSSH